MTNFIVIRMLFVSRNKRITYQLLHERLYVKTLKVNGLEYEDLIRCMIIDDEADYAENNKNMIAIKSMSF